jgi:hypothetical protein
VASLASVNNLEILYIKAIARGVDRPCNDRHTIIHKDETGFMIGLKRFPNFVVYRIVILPITNVVIEEALNDLLILICNDG